MTADSIKGIEKMLTLKEVGQLLGCRPRYVAEVLIGGGALKAKKIGRSFRIRPVDLAKWQEPR